LLTNPDLFKLSFSNSFNSTNIQEIETADDIRNSAAANYKMQYRVVTDRDYETFIKTNFANFIGDLKVINNQTFVDTYLKYFYNIGLTNISQITLPLLNQVQFADSCNFNNVYIVGLSKGASQNFNYLSTAQKEIIINALNKVKVLTTNTVFVDPVYKGLSFGLTKSLNPINDANLNALNIYKESFSQRNNNDIKNDIVKIFLNYFDQANIRLGQIIEIQKLTQDILAIDGVKSIETVQFDNEGESTINKFSGLSFYYWNILYPNNDSTIVTNNVTTELFEVPFLYDRNNLANKIQIIDNI
jgi:hypothetical protein